MNNNEELILLYQESLDPQNKKILKNEIFNNMKKLIENTVYKFQNSHGFFLIKEDLLQEANLVFLLCLEKYDAGKKNRFSTYLVTAIINKIRKTIKKENEYKNLVSDLINSFANENELLNIEEMEKIENNIYVSDILRKVDKPASELLSCKYGLNNCKEITNKEISEKYRLDESRINYILKKTFNNIKKKG